MEEVNIDEEMGHCLTNEIVYRTPRTLKENELDALNEWLQQQPSEEYGLMSFNVEAIRLVEGRPGVACIRWRNHASTGLVKHTVGLICLWAKRNRGSTD